MISYCSELSAGAGEALVGTASQAKVWLLLEYNGAWGEKAFEESQLPKTVKDYLSAAIAVEGGISEAKLVLIRRPQAARTDARLMFYMAAVRDIDPILFAFPLNTYEDLLDIDLRRAAAGDGGLDAHRMDGSLYLVCTNGRRDACCALWGMPVYESLYGHFQTGTRAVWQCTHVGGHRFAANVIHLPYGIFYGRIRPEAVPALVAAEAQGQIYLDAMRGRGCYSEAAQAAEIYLRRQTGNLGAEAYFLRSINQAGPGEWEICFGERGKPVEYRLRIGLENTGLSVPSGCRSDKTSPVVHYRLLA